MNLTQLKSLLAVIDTGSFAAASKKLGISQPAVSQHVRKLEESLGACLIERGPVRCRVTKRAEEFLRHARSLIDLAELARQSLDQSRLRVGASSNVGTYLIQPVFSRFISEVGVSGNILIDTNPAIAAKLQRGEIDVAAMEWWNDEEDGAGRFRNLLWRDEPVVLIVGPQHRWAGRKTIRPEALIEEKILGGEKGTGTGRILNEALGDLAGHLTISQTLGSTEAVKEGVKAGLGVSLVLRESVREELLLGSLCEISLKGIRLRKGIRLVTSANLPASSVASRFCEFAKEAAA